MNRTPTLTFTAVLLTLLPGLHSADAQPRADQAGRPNSRPSPNDVRPNILIITADNLGYGDLPCYNPESTIKAPNLDRLAAQGAKLTSFYTASPTCTVSRACLLTGRIPQRHGLDYQLPGVKGNYGVGLNQNETLIPQILKTAPTPYATGCFGKWNIGFAKGSRPSDRVAELQAAFADWEKSF